MTAILTALGIPYPSVLGAVCLLLFVRCGRAGRQPSFGVYDPQSSVELAPPLVAPVILALVPSGVCWCRSPWRQPSDCDDRGRRSCPVGGGARRCGRVPTLTAYCSLAWRGRQLPMSAGAGETNFPAVEAGGKEPFSVTQWLGSPSSKVCAQRGRDVLVSPRRLLHFASICRPI